MPSMNKSFDLIAMGFSSSSEEEKSTITPNTNYTSLSPFPANKINKISKSS